MAAYGGYTYNGSYTTTDQVADGRRKPIMSYNTKGNTDQWHVTKSEIVVEQLCVYRYTQNSSVSVVEVSRDNGGVEDFHSCISPALEEDEVCQVIENKPETDPILQEKENKKENKHKVEEDGENGEVKEKKKHDDDEEEESEVHTFLVVKCCVSLSR